VSLGEEDVMRSFWKVVRSHRWSLLCLLALSSIGGMRYYQLRASRGDEGVVFVPATIDLSGETVMEEGPPVEVNAALVNRSVAPVEVVEFVKSCGCMTEDPKFLPKVLQPGESCPVRLRVNVRQRNGKQDLVVSAVSKSSDGRQLPRANLAIHAYVRKSLTVLPERYYDPIEEDEPGRRVKRTFILADDLPGSGGSPPSLSSTNPERIRLDLRPATGMTAWNGMNPLSNRFELDVTYDPDPGAKEYRETITIKAGDRAEPQTVEMRGGFVPSVSLEPAQLIVQSASPGAVESRIVECRFRHPRYSKIRAEADSSAVAVHKESQSDSFVRFKVSCTMPSQPSSTTSLVRFVAGDQGKTMTLPVTVSLVSPP
jgi:hypothetical protein